MANDLENSLSDIIPGSNSSDSNGPLNPTGIFRTIQTDDSGVSPAQQLSETLPDGTTRLQQAGFTPVQYFRTGSEVTINPNPNNAQINPALFFSSPVQIGVVVPMMMGPDMAIAMPTLVASIAPVPVPATMFSDGNIVSATALAPQSAFATFAVTPTSAVPNASEDALEQATMPASSTSTSFSGVTANVAFTAPVSAESFEGVTGSAIMPNSYGFNGASSGAMFNKTGTNLIFPGNNSIPIMQNLAVPSGAEKPIKKEKKE